MCFLDVVVVASQKPPSPPSFHEMSFKILGRRRKKRKNDLLEAVSDYKHMRNNMRQN